MYTKKLFYILTLKKKIDGNIYARPSRMNFKEIECRKLDMIMLQVPFLTDITFKNGKKKLKLRWM